MIRHLLVSIGISAALAGSHLAAQEAAPPAAPAIVEPTAPPAVSGEAAGVAAPELSKADVLVAKIKAGGKTGGVIILVSIFALGFALERVFCLRRRIIAPSGLAAEADALWKAGKMEEIKTLCESRPSTLGRVILTMVRHRTSTAAEITMMVSDITSGEMKLHLQRAYPLAIAATVSPLLGLLGTVFGMIQCFDDVAAMGTLGNAAVLADGISLALVTTAEGLVVAIPSLAIYHALRSRTHLLALNLDRQVSQLMSEWFIEKA